MSLRSFAQTHRLAARKDVDATDIIPGKRGHIYEYSPDELGVIFMPLGKPRTRLWNSLRSKCIAAGMTLRQDGDAEGALSFDAKEPERARLAIHVAGIRRKRQLSAEHKAKLLAATATSRFKRQGTVLNEGYASQERAAGLG